MWYFPVSEIYQTTCHPIPEDSYLHVVTSVENLKITCENFLYLSRRKYWREEDSENTTIATAHWTWYIRKCNITAKGKIKYRLIYNSLVRQQQFILQDLRWRQCELWERYKWCENNDEIMIITTACSKACTLDTCIFRSGMKHKVVHNLLKCS